VVATVKAAGRIGVVGVFVPEDPGSKDTLQKRGQMATRAVRLTTQAPSGTWAKAAIGVSQRPQRGDAMA
jgi:hypothetical protein